MATNLDDSPPASIEGEPAPGAGGASTAPGRPSRLSVVLSVTAATAIFFRSTLLSWFDRLMGDDGDARLIALIHEHWFEVVRGRQSWRDPAFFFPQKGVLGYSDGLFLDNIVYLPLRLMRFDIFLASQLTTIVVMTVSYLAMIRILNRYCRLDATHAIPLAMVATFSNGLYLQYGHAQLYALGWIPIIAVLTVESARCARRGPRIGGLFVAGLMTGLLFLTSYYIAWFSILVLVMVAAVWIVVSLAFNEPPWASIRRAFSVDLVAVVTGFAVGLIPFLVAYLPTMGLTASQSSDEVRSLSPWASDMFNTGAGNLIWGRILQVNSPHQDRLANIELTGSPTPTLIALMVIAAFLVWRRRGSAGRVGQLGIAFAATSLLVWVLPVVTRGWSLWNLVWGLAPGSHAIRVPGRIWLVDNVLVVIAIGVLLGSLFRSADTPPHRPKVPAVLLLSLCWLAAVEQVNFTTNARLDRSDNLALIESVPVPPTTCDSFFVIDDRQRGRALTELDAMVVSEASDLPTLNGFSGAVPPGWNLYPDDAGYVSHVEQWLEISGLPAAGVCSYDLASNTWGDPLP